MPNRSQDRRTDRATADEVAEVERQLWEFAKRIDPPSVPEAKLRPGAFLYRVHRTWHSLGRGTGGLASRSFRALRDELLRRDPPVRNLQPKLYGNTPFSHAEAEQLIDVMLESWHLERSGNGRWQARPLSRPELLGPADSQDLEAIRENLLHTLFKGEDLLLLEDPVGILPEIFFEERGRTSKALIILTKGETIARLSPSNAYGGFSELIGLFFDAATKEGKIADEIPLLIWILRLPAIRNNPEFHQAFHSLVIYSAALTNWYFRLKRKSAEAKQSAENLWKLIIENSAFVINGLPNWLIYDDEDYKKDHKIILDDDLYDIDLNFFLPNTIPIRFETLPELRKHKGYSYDLTVTIEKDHQSGLNGYGVKYWLFPERPISDLDDTADTTGLPVIDTDISPGDDYNLAYSAVYEAVAYKFGRKISDKSYQSAHTLKEMGWTILTIPQLQVALSVDDSLENKDVGR